uniref:Uncharacterized protein n=1 Tax=Medicago truncatula TaxID=3880 RepID=I3SLH9_MEDTR|nr:unknown [Medicago truncatula]
MNFAIVNKVATGTVTYAVQPVRLLCSGSNHYQIIKICFSITHD